MTALFTVLFTALLLGLGVHYLAWMWAYAVGFRRVSRSATTPSSEHPFVSVVVPARNEAEGVEACLQRILANDYPSDRFEVLLVDDASTDGTGDIARRLARRVNRVAVGVGVGASETEQAERLRVLEAPDDPNRLTAHKKAALARGIAVAVGDIILTTDADCRVPPGWIRTMAASFDEATGFVSGPVLYPAGGSLWTRLQALEFLALVGLGAGAIGIDRPNMCNGANAAYRREVYETLGGFAGLDHLASGDDELLMQRIAYETPCQVRFCAAPAAAVGTDPSPNPAAFIAQRRRWASKGLFYPHRPLVRTIAAFYLFYVLLLGGLIALPFVGGTVLPAGIALGLKAAADVPLTVRAARHFDRTGLLPLIPLLFVLHLPYVIVMGAAGAFGGITWKGRTLRR